MTKEEAINKAIELEFGVGNIQGIRAHNSSLVNVAEHLYDLIQPSLPSNLDEEAEDSWAVYEYRESPRGLYSTCYVDGFKAGAEWMAGQGYTKEGIARPDDCEVWVNFTNTDIKDGDEVIVQIRKK